MSEAAAVGDGGIGQGLRGQRVRCDVDPPIDGEHQKAREGEGGPLVHRDVERGSEGHRGDRDRDKPPALQPLGAHGS